MSREREILHLNHFKSIFPSFPEGEFDEKEIDKPDFIIHTIDHLLGIEHTEIFQTIDSNGFSLQAKDKNAQILVDKAYNFFIGQHNQSPNLQIFFDPRIPIGKEKDFDSLANKIAYLIELTLIDQNLPLTIKHTKENFEYFPKEIARICLYPCSNGNGKWHCSSSGFIPAITSADLQDKINIKEPKIDTYKIKCSEIWLLIVADDNRNPSTLDLTFEAANHSYKTRFDRVFFFWNGRRQFIECKLEK
jgi:hypothetical protein